MRNCGRGRGISLPSDVGDVRARCLTLAAALAGWALDGFEMGVYPVIARPALRELLPAGASEELIRQWNGWLSIAFLLGAAVGGVLFGRLGDRTGRVKAMTLAVLTYTAWTGLAAFARSPIQLAGCRGLAALGMGGEWALGVALVVETWPDSARPWLAGTIGAAVNIGYVGVALLARLLPPGENWRLILALCAAPALLTFLLRAFVPESQRWREAAAGAPRARLGELFAGPMRRTTLLAAAACALVLLAIWGAVQFTQLWAAQLAGDATAAARVQFTSAGAASVGALLAPVLLARVSRRRGYFLLSAAAFVSAEWLFLTHREFDEGFLLAVAVAGLCTGAFSGWLPLYLPELFPTRLRAMGQGFAYNAGRVFAAAGVWITTVPLDVRGNYPQTCALVSGAYGVGLLLASRLPEGDSQGRPGLIHR